MVLLGSTDVERHPPTKAHTPTKARQIEIFGSIVRHLTALVYLIAELVLKEKPESLK